jgi:hypothetical protein
VVGLECGDLSPLSKGATSRANQSADKSAHSKVEGTTMARFNNPLVHVRVAAPCKADWDQMIGSDRVRFCAQCSLNVYNLSAMTRSDAESLIARTEGRLCIGFYRRRDGSIITKDCPVGFRAIRRRVSYVAKAISSMVLGLFAGLGVHEVFSVVLPSRLERTMGVIARNVDPPVPLMGKVIPVEDRLLVENGRMQLKPDRPHTTSGQSKKASKR